LQLTNISYLKVVSWLRWLFAERSLRRFGVDTGKVLVRLVADEVELGQVFF